MDTAKIIFLPAPDICQGNSGRANSPHPWNGAISGSPVINFIVTLLLRWGSFPQWTSGVNHSAAREFLAFETFFLNTWFYSSLSTRSHGLTFCSGIAGGGAGIAIALTEACPGATVWPSTCTQLHPSYCTTCKKCQGKKVISVFLWGLAVYEPKFIQVDATSEGDMGASFLTARWLPTPLLKRMGAEEETAGILWWFSRRVLLPGPKTHLAVVKTFYLYS